VWQGFDFLVNKKRKTSRVLRKELLPRRQKKSRTAKPGRARKRIFQKFYRKNTEKIFRVYCQMVHA